MQIVYAVELFLFLNKPNNVDQNQIDYSIIALIAVHYQPLRHVYWGLIPCMVYGQNLM